MRAEDVVRIEHMIEATEAAMSFVQGRTRADLDRDRMLQFALTRVVEVIGEAASKVSNELRTQTRQIPWRDITDTRNRLVHAYFNVDLDVLWATVSDDLPELLERLKSVSSNA